MTAAPFLTRLIHRFWADERAAIAMETAIITPVLAWCYITSFVFFDAFRTYSSSVKATYAISDVISRQTMTLQRSDIDGYAALLDNLVRAPGGVRLRVSQIVYDSDTDSHCVEWSQATNGEAALFTANLADMRAALPTMVDAERLILVQSFIPYSPAFDIGIELLTFTNFTFTRPRYAGRIPFQTQNTC